MVGTDIFHVAALLYVAGIRHWVAGNVDRLLLGSIPDVLAGGKLSLSVPDNLLRFALATVLGLSGLKLGIGMTALLVYIGRCRWVRYSRRYGGGRPVVEPRVGTEAA